MNLLRRRRNECIYSTCEDYSRYPLIAGCQSNRLVYVLYLFARERKRNRKLSFQYWHQPFVIFVYKWCALKQQIKNGKKSLYLEYDLNIDVRVNALNDPLIWFYIWRSPLIAQNKHVALTTVFRLRKKEKQDCPATTQCWFVKVDLKTLLQLAVVDKHWLAEKQMWRTAGKKSYFSVFVSTSRPWSSCLTDSCSVGLVSE